MLNVMVKKHRIETWELIWLSVSMIALGFMLGYGIADPSSRMSKPEVRDEMLANVPMIIVVIIFGYVVVKNVLRFSRWMKLKKED